jgi:hypothetical protein
MGKNKFTIEIGGRRNGKTYKMLETIKNTTIYELNKLYKYSRIAIPCANGQPIKLIAEIRKGTR